ncbi:AAA ATPase domain protein [Collinsella sp. AK_207A]|uniref:ATP-binding protein n=1 Tax=Collinsella sp. AK_207A TaxID=2650472 RepID=UPI001289ABEE|nr:ATP-binding protein [Collinsella sp. AK_207A]VWL88545.1 AAA ATPase domain protein [Collinsella sp. AK_207A]
MPNPFKPTAGKMPPILIGRQSIIDDFKEGLENGAGAPGRLMLITGQRGYGKTVMLTELGRVAKDAGWEVISETASEGMCDRLASALVRPGMKLRGVNVQPSIGVSGILNASLGGASFSVDQVALTLREVVNQRLAKMPRGKGIVFTIDEAQAASMADMVALATTIQHVIRDEDMRDVSDSDKHGVAFVFAALPSLMDELLHERVLTFLRRSVQHDLGLVAYPDVRSAYIEVVREGGLAIDSEVAELAAEASDGYPYMIQLVGYYMWRAAEVRGSKEIEEADVIQGKKDALVLFDDAVCAPLFDGLTAAQKLFVKAVAKEAPQPAKVSEIANRAHRSASWVSKYRASLIKERVVESAGYGLVRLSASHLAEYVQSLR